MAEAFETIILRFRDLVTAGNETIEKHREIIRDREYVWWGWWKKGHEQLPEDDFAVLRQKGKKPLYVYLIDSGRNLAYRARCKEIEMSSEEELESPEKERTPAYYRDQRYPAWFCFTSLEKVDESEITGFSYVDCKALFSDTEVDYSKFDNKKIYSIAELVQQNRTVWFVRKARDSDRCNEIVLLNSGAVEPAHFSGKYHQPPGDTLLWLSDLHLSDAVFPLEPGTPRRTLTDHLAKCVRTHKIAGLLITGDITSQARDEGFRQAERLLRDINGLVPALNSETVLLCPGNHDFRWESVRLRKKETPAFLHEKPENSTGFSGLYRSVYQLRPNRYFASGRKLLLTSGHLVEIAALNSLTLQQYPNFEGHGYLSQEQLDFVAEKMGWNGAGNPAAIRVVMMHHHYFPACYQEIIDVTRASSAVYDADRLMKWLVEHNVRLLLHGHKHQSFVSQVRYPPEPGRDIDTRDLRQVTVVGMGGTGSKGTDNKYAALRFEGGEAVVEFYKISSAESEDDRICQTVRILL